MSYRISVIMGIYNCAGTLNEALDSLIAQTYQGFKVIMCDDGSKDDSLSIAQEYVQNYPNKFILIKNDVNLGLNATLNKCLDLVDTEYVARMDGDDISLPNRFQEEISFLDSNKDVAIVSSPMIYFDNNGEFKRGKGSFYVTKNDFLAGSPICHATCMVRTEAYRAVNGYSVDPKLLRVEDYHLWFKMFSKGFRSYVLPDPLYMMRDDRNAMLRRTWQNRLNEYHVRNIGYKMIGIPWYKRFWIFRPILVGLLPNCIYQLLHKRLSN